MIGKRVGQIIAVFVIGAVGGIFATEILWPSVVEGPLFNGYQLPQKKVQINKTENITVTENQALQDAVQEVKPSLVAVKGKRQGSGFIATSDGLIVTLNSIAQSTSTVVYRGEELEAGLVKAGETFTTLRIEKNNLPTRGFAEVDQAQLGQRVFLAGKLLREEPITIINHGVIKYFDQQGVHTNIFEIDTLGGSPLLNIKGEVLGLVTIDQQGKVVGIPLPKVDELVE